MLKCFSLAQGDANLTKKIFEIDGYLDEPVVEMLSSAENRDAMSPGSDIIECDSLLLESNRVAIESKFVFKRDLYGGYGLFTWQKIKLILGVVIQQKLWNRRGEPYWETFWANQGKLMQNFNN